MKMIKSIIMDDYCLRFFKHQFTVTDANNKLVFYNMLEFQEYDNIEDDLFPLLYPSQVSYDVDSKENEEMIELMTKIVGTEVLHKRIAYFIKLFTIVKEQVDFNNYIPGDYLNNNDGEINEIEFRHYLKRYKKIKDNPDMYFVHDEPYSEAYNKFKFLHLRVHLSNEPVYSQLQEITREEFEFNIPNEKIANAYINVFDCSNKFYVRKDGNDIGYAVKNNEEVKLLFETNKK